jgi:hypothetical protein
VGSKEVKPCTVPGRFLVAAARVAAETDRDRVRRISIRGGRVEATDTRTLLRMTGPGIDPGLRALLPVPLPLPRDAEIREFRAAPSPSGGTELISPCDGGVLSIRCARETDDYVDTDSAYEQGGLDKPPLVSIRFTAALLARVLEDMRIAADGGNDMIVRMEVRSPSGPARLVCTDPAGDPKDYKVEALIMPCRPWPAPEE